MNKKIIKFSNIQKLSISFKKKGKKIILCHGVFDLLHLGHLRHFKEAKEFGDILFVSITEDKFINKGFNRPYFNTDQRLEALSLINSIDYIFVNESSDAIKSIKELRPNIYCKGQDYKIRNSDITLKIKKEENECKKNGGIIKFTKSEMFSSSKLLNSVEGKNDKLQKYLVELKSKNFSKKIIEKIDDLNKKEVVLIGETIIDKYNFCETLGKSGKEPHLVLKNINEENYLGGVIAIAKNLAPLCKTVKVISVLGEKKEYLNFIKKNLPSNVKLDLIYKKNSSTICKTRFVDKINKYKVLGVYDVDDENLSLKEEKDLNKKITQSINKDKIVIVSDYGHGMISKKNANLICKKSNFLSLNTQMNASNKGYHSVSKYKGYSFLIINDNELRYELRDRTSNLKVLSNLISKKNNIKKVVITKGQAGSILYDKKSKNYIECPALINKVIDKVGAGDFMLSIMSLLINSKLEDKASLFVGNLVGAMSISNMANSEFIDKINLKKKIIYTLK